MNAYTKTRTYTKTDIRQVWECFSADLLMLATRTQALDKEVVKPICHDIHLMAENRCLAEVHIQLFDCLHQRVKAHKYTISENISRANQRPGANSWPRLPDGSLSVIVSYSDREKADKLKKSGQLKRKWTRSNLDTRYSDMSSDGERFYSSNNYGCSRKSFSRSY